MRFGELLHQYRVAARRSLRDLATEVGLSAIYISDVERGARRAPSIYLIFRFARALKVEPLHLMEAALRERDSVELPVTTDAAGKAKRKLALALACAWEDLPDWAAEDINGRLSLCVGSMRARQSHG